MYHSKDSAIYVFDMDGTLTPARKPMTPDFAAVFEKFLRKKKAFIATGSDFKKVQEQLCADTISLFEGIYCSMGNLLLSRGKVIYQRDVVIPQSMLDKFEHYRASTKYPYNLFPNYIEKRPGMVNFSVIGRDCPYEERERYKSWDAVAGERAAIQKELLSLFPGWEVAVGGSISMDITLAGCGKSQIAVHLRKTFPKSEIFFFGDKTFPGGNDYELAQALLKLEKTAVIQVENPDELLQKLKDFE